LYKTKYQTSVMHPASYEAEFIRFVRFLGVECAVPSDVTSERLLQITPSDICRYMNYKTYGKPEPNIGDLPTGARSNTLKAMKKKLSKFMPRQNQVWDEIRGEGNPTRAIPVNDLIKRVMKAEVRHQGKPSQARRPVTIDEFYSILRICKVKELYRLSSILTLQWHLIGRVDDMMKLRRKEMSSNIEHKLALTVQMRWSKNITEERESPRQIVLGSYDDRMCVLLNLAIYLEMEGEQVDCEQETFLFGNGIDGDRSVRSALIGVLESSDFSSQSEGPLGTHSIRKGPATYAARCGISKDAIESRGRWRSGTRQVDTYMDIQRPYPDAQVAACLCGPAGPVLYKVNSESPWVTQDFLCEKIAPGIFVSWAAMSRRYLLYHCFGLRFKSFLNVIEKYPFFQPD
jgi:hypothetical protein